MAYEIYLGDCALYGVISVEESAARSVSEHDAIGLGIFTIAQNAGLRSWNIKLELTQNDLGQDGWRKASTVLEELEEIRNDKNGHRLVVIAPKQRLSKLVLLRDIKIETSYEGAYSVSLSLSEYVKAQVKTSGVPSVTQPGKVPDPPVTTRVKSAFKINLEACKRVDYYDDHYYYGYANPDTGKTVNPAGLDDEEVVKVIIGDSNSAFVTEQQKEEAAMGYEISNAYDDFDNVMGSE